MIISGYPSSKNGFHADKPDAVQHVYCLLFNHFEYHKDTDDLYFHFDSQKNGALVDVRTPQRRAIPALSVGHEWCTRASDYEKHQYWRAGPEGSWHIQGTS